MRKNKGFTIVEALVYTAMMAFILGGLYTMIIYYKNVSTTEQSRVRLIQESRFVLSNLSEELKDAGAVLTLLNTGGFLKATPYFNGIFPLNNTNFPDGIIIAKGEPNAVTSLTSNFNPSSSTQLSVETTYRKDVTGNIYAWSVGDKGIVITQNGYYVFYVTGVNANSLSIRASAVYYSGLLNTTNYKDKLIQPATQNGNNIIYPSGTPVIKLYSFSIYLVQQVYDQSKNRNVRRLIRITDTKGQADALNNTAVVKGVEAENIWDLQIVYTIFPDLNDITTEMDYCAKDPNKWTNPIENPCASDNNCPTFLNYIRQKQLKEMTIRVVVITDDYSTKTSIANQIPVIGDENKYTLTGPYKARILTISVDPRNFNIIL